MTDTLRPVPHADGTPTQRKAKPTTLSTVMAATRTFAARSNSAALAASSCLLRRSAAASRPRSCPSSPAARCRAAISWPSSLRTASSRPPCRPATSASAALRDSRERTRRSCSRSLTLWGSVLLEARSDGRVTSKEGIRGCNQQRRFLWFACGSQELCEVYGV